MKTLVEHLTWFALDQLRTLGRGGRPYVRKCIALWEQEYGKSVADEVRAILNNSKEGARGEREAR